MYERDGRSVHTGHQYIIHLSAGAPEHSRDGSSAYRGRCCKLVASSGGDGGMAVSVLVGVALACECCSNIQIPSCFFVVFVDLLVLHARANI